jgi:hypothetical protein
VTVGHGLAAVTAGAAAIGLAAPTATTPVQTSAGPCNMVTVNVNSSELSHGIVEGLSVKGKLGSFAVKDIKVYLAVNVRTGNLTCTTTSSASQVGQNNTVQGPTTTTSSASQVGQNNAVQAPTATEKPLRQECSSTRTCIAQGLVRLQGGGDARQRVTVQTGRH